MSSLSPAAVLFSTDGYEQAVVNNAPIPTGTRGLLAAGSDGTNARFILIDGSARQVIVGAGTAGSQSGGVITIQGDPAGTPVPVSGTVAVTQSTSPWVTNISQFGGSNVVTGTGTSGAGIPRVTVSNDSNILATQSGTWTVQPGNTPNTTPWLVLSDGYVTTAAPTYTNNTTNYLSLTTAGALRVDGSAVTQPVSGTVTANQGTPNSLANRWPVTVTDGTNTMPTGDAVGRAIFEKITDGTNTAAVKAASTAPVAADPALVVAISPNSPALSVITDKSSTGTITSVVGSTSDTTVLATNTNRVSATIYNATNKTMYVALAGTASTSSYTVQVFQGSFWELPVSYTGPIHAVWASGVSGSALVTELT